MEKVDGGGAVARDGFRANQAAGSGTLAKLRHAAVAMKGRGKALANYVLEDPHRVAYESITEVAQRCGVSQSAVVRFCKALGFSGYPEFRIALAQDIVDFAYVELEAVNAGDDVLTVVRKIAAANVRAIEDTLDLLDLPRLVEAADLIRSAGRITVHSAGPTYGVAMEAFNRFTRLGLSVAAHGELHAQMVAAGQLTSGDVAIGISHSGQSIGTVEPLRTARELGAKTISITRLGRSPLASVSDIVLTAASVEAPQASRGRVSRTAMNFVVECLFVLVSRDLEGIADSPLQRSREALERLRGAALTVPFDE